MEVALWAFSRSNSSREGALLAVNLGDDADTTGAIYGQLAGAFYGAEQLPLEWRAKLTMHDFIREMADQVFAIAQQRNPGQ
jgi:ADP-ribosyl-[dinitrogen reductase] hydrolase